MKVLVDTCIWSLVFRRQTKPVAERKILTDLILNQRVAMIGPIRQELLSGIRDENVFAKLKEHMSAFPDIQLQTIDYERAAELSNAFHKKGIQSSAVDALICSVAIGHQLKIFTTDKDFLRYQKIVPIKVMGC